MPLNDNEGFDTDFVLSKSNILNLGIENQIETKEMKKRKNRLI